MSIEASATQSAVLLTQQEKQLLFEDSHYLRPPADFMSGLIRRGVTEDVIINAGAEQGLVVPEMSTTLSDLQNALPYHNELTATIAEKCTGKLAVFAGRDAESLYDTYAIEYPGHSATLLPASSRLWRSESMEKDELASAFFEQHNIHRQDVLRGDVALFDTGFAGTIGTRVWNRLSDLYHVPYDRIGMKLPIWLVSHQPRREIIPCGQLINFDARARSLIQDPFPRTTAAINFDGAIQHDETFDPRTYPLTYRLATTMQLLPRYHGTYEQLKEQCGAVIAVPEPAADQHTTKAFYHNDSVVSRVAAAVVQYRTVQHAIDS